MSHNEAVAVTLGPGEVHAYYRVTDALDDRAIEDAVAVLSAEERAHYRRFRFERDRCAYAVAHALLRLSLSRHAEVAPQSWAFREEPGGKPALLAPAGAAHLSFNLSHTHGLVACAITSVARVGIDVEAIDRRVDDRVVRRFFSPAEAAALSRCRPGALRAGRFFDLWTLKEAYIKAIGRGLSHPLTTIVFTIDDYEAIAFTPPPDVDAASWSFRLFAPTERHRLAIAVATPRDAPASISLLEA
jgi:4'-phosphopantetheinyl transferase